MNGWKSIETESVDQCLPGAGAVGGIGSDCICDYKKNVPELDFVDDCSTL